MNQPFVFGGVSFLDTSANHMPHEWVRFPLSCSRQGTLPAVTESFKAVVKRPDKTPRRLTSPKYTTKFPNYFLGLMVFIVFSRDSWGL